MQGLLRRGTGRQSRSRACPGGKGGCGVAGGHGLAWVGVWAGWKPYPATLCPSRLLPGFYLGVSLRLGHGINFQLGLLSKLLAHISRSLRLYSNLAMCLSQRRPPGLGWAGGDWWVVWDFLLARALPSHLACSGGRVGRSRGASGERWQPGLESQPLSPLFSKVHASK